MKYLRSSLQNLSPAWRWSLPIWFAGRIFISAWGALLWLAGLPPFNTNPAFYFEIQPLTTGLAAPLLGIWQRWDGINYLRIVLSGYHADDLTAFFPLYPLLGRGLARLTGIDPLVALILIANLAFLFALVLLYQITCKHYSENAARGAVVAAAMFPTAFFFYAPYPQSLALLLTLLAWWGAYHRRWLLALLAGIAAGLAHSTVVPLALMLAFEAVRAVRTGTQKRRWIALLVPFAPLMGVALFLAWRESRQFVPIDMVMAVLWGRISVWPWQSFLDIPKMFIYGWVKGSGWTNLLLLALAIAALVWGWRRLLPAHWLYQFVLLLFLLSTEIRTGPLVSFGRYMLVMFPIFILIGQWATTKNRRLASLTVGMVLQLFLSGLFFLWAWVD